MLGLSLDMPFGYWREEYSSSYRVSHPLPPLSTCMGFLLSLIGEEEIDPYRGTKIAVGIKRFLPSAFLLRKIYMQQKQKTNIDKFEVFCDPNPFIWIEHPELEEKVTRAIRNPEEVERYGILSLGESTCLVNKITILGDRFRDEVYYFVNNPAGLRNLPLISDHRDSSKTVYATGDFVPIKGPPGIEMMHEL